VAVSNPEHSRDVGVTLSSAYVHSTLSNANPEKYFVSPFEETPMYDGRHTYIYSASVTDIDNPGRTLGGIGIVFDSEPEFRTMLDDALKSKKDTFAVFTDRKGRVISSTAGLAAGDCLKLPSYMFGVKKGESHREILVYNGSYYAVGCACSSSYREYKSSDGYNNDVLAFVFEKLTQEEDESIVAEHAGMTIEQWNIVLHANGTHEKLVTFCVNSQLFALKQDVVFEATDMSDMIKLPDSSDMVRGALFYNNRYIAVVDSHALFKYNKSGSPGNHLIILKLEEDVFVALEVDEINNVLEVNANDIRPIPELSGRSSVSGIICIRGEKECNMLLLNPQALLTKLEEGQSGYDWEEILAVIEKMNEEKTA
jgi:chemotaxis signal transduction protein